MAIDIKNDATLSTSLISVWCSTSTVTQDLHGTNTLTDNNTVTTAVGKQGTASQFTAANSEYLSIVDNAGLSITGDLTVACWIYLDSAITGWVPIIDKDGGAPNRSYVYGLREVSGDNYEVVQSTDGSNANTTNYRAAAGITFSTGTWYHIVMAYDASAGTVACYRNGSLDTTITSTYTSIYNSTAQFNIGTYLINSLYMNGRLNQVCLWNKTISSGEVTSLYNGGAGLPYQGYSIACAAGSFTLTGNNINFLRSYRMLCEVGAFTLTSINAILRRGYSIVCSAGSFVLTGVDAIFSKFGWTNRTKPTTTFTDRTKPSTSFTDRTKPTTTWTKHDTY